MRRRNRTNADGCNADCRSHHPLTSAPRNRASVVIENVNTTVGTKQCTFVEVFYTS